MLEKKFKNGFWCFGDKKTTKKLIIEIEKNFGHADISGLTDSQISEFKKLNKNLKSKEESANGRWLFYPPINKKYEEETNLIYFNSILLSYFAFKKKKDFILFEVKNKIGKNLCVISK